MDKEDKSGMNQYVEPSPYADPEAAMRKRLEIASTVEPVQDGRIHIEKIKARSYSRGKAC
jgi:hypothetical protein